MAKTNKISNPLQLDLFQLQIEYPKEIVNNPIQEIDLDDLDMSQNVLICNVKPDNVEHFLNGTAKVYYTGKRFPATIALNKLHYFIPYIGKKCDLNYYGVRDLYLIKIARVGSRREGELDNDPNDLRIVFELQFVKHIFPDYKKIRLQIWDTYTDTTLEEVCKAKSSNRLTMRNLSYVSLFSCAGVGCYGFKQENYNCVATVELIECRLNVQRYNRSNWICSS